MQSLPPEEYVRGWFEKRMAHAPLLRKAVLDDFELLLRGRPALFVERYAEIREEVLWVCMTYGVHLSAPLRVRQ